MRKLYFSILLASSFSLASAQTTLDTALNFSGKDIYGTTHNLFNILDSGQYVLLDFFTTSCGPCVLYAPDIQQAYLHFGANQDDVFVLGINYGDDNTGVAYFDSLYGITFPTISGQNGHGNTIALQVFDVQSFPTLVFIAPDRTILNQQIYPPSFPVIDSTLSAGLGIFTAQENLPASLSGITLDKSFPNPVAEALQLSIDLPEPARISYRVTAITGSEVLSKQDVLFSRGRQTLTIPATGLQPGIYFVMLFTADQTVAVLKFIKR